MRRFVSATCNAACGATACRSRTRRDASRRPIAAKACSARAPPGRGGPARGGIMKLSTDRILTTHVGSLPRPAHLVELLMLKDRGEPYDQAELDRTVSSAVAEIVRRQAEVGIDVIDDGEMSKPGYS